MATWRNGSAFGFDRRRLSPAYVPTKRLQVRVLRWSYILSLQDLTMGFVFVRTRLEKVHERGEGGEGQFGARMCAGAYVRRVVKRVCG